MNNESIGDERFLYFDAEGSAPGTGDLPEPYVVIPHDWAQPESDVIDDELIQAYRNSDGIPFRVPRWNGMAEGQRVFIYINGIVANTEEVRRSLPPSEGGGFPLYIDLSIEFQHFEYSGKYDVYYLILAAAAGAGVEYGSRHAIGSCRRSHFSDPFMNMDSALESPNISPKEYNPSNFGNGNFIKAEIRYPKMRRRDWVSLVFELRNKGATEYYKVGPFGKEIGKPELDAGVARFLILSGQLGGDIPENIGVAYFSVQSAEDRYLLVHESRRVQVAITTVPSGSSNPST